MFLDRIIDRNPKFLKACIELHQRGEIPSNNYVLDLDTISNNARHLANEGARYGLKVFAMSKQFGRNPEVLKTIKAAGIDHCVCVDMNDARPVHASGLSIGHLGHLVQVPLHETKAALAMNPLYWTVFSVDKAKAISDHKTDGAPQDILLRIWDNKDNFYPGHEGGIHIDDILKTLEELKHFDGVRFAGLTTFPTQLFNSETRTVEHTPNYTTLLETKDKIEQKLGHKIEVNAPGTTSSMLFSEMAEKGITQVEPGHGLTGTCPQHLFNDLPELPAMAYLSEVSHIHKGNPYCFGGGMYVDPVFGNYDVKACVGNSYEKSVNNKIVCTMPKPESIDYYGILDKQPANTVHTGDSVVFGFRAQVFVTRAYVVPVSGIHSAKPTVKGIFNSEGRAVGWPEW